MDKVAVIFSTYKTWQDADCCLEEVWRKWVLDNYNSVKDGLLEGHELFLSVDVDRASPAYYLELFGEDAKLIQFNDNDEAVLQRLGMDSVDPWGHCDVTILNVFLKGNNDYDYYYLIEHDLFSDDWGEVFRSMRDVDADLICTNVIQHIEDEPYLEDVKISDGGWVWWGGVTDSVWRPRLGLFGAFQRHSKRLVESLIDARKEAPLCFWEALVPTVAHSNGFSIKQLHVLDREGVLNTPIYHSKGHNHLFYGKPENSFWKLVRI
jgi:hypothetical protein